VDVSIYDQLPQMTEDSVEQMLALAERLREANGGELDESAIQAVAEATGAPIEYVRLAVKLRAEKEKMSLAANVRAQFLLMGSDTRRYVLSGLAAVACAILNVTNIKIDQVTDVVNGSRYGVFGMVALVIAALAMYNVSLAREARTAALAGAIFGGGYYLVKALFAMVLQVQANFGEFLLVPYTIVGAVLGLVFYRIMERNRAKLGLKDPVRDRQEMLRQLVDLREKLHSGSQSMTFLSLDIVGSTQMKESADPLAVEFTFNEYHDFVDRLAAKYGGRVHSTAGDGIICAFESPAAALGAAKNIQAGLFELNSLRNKIGTPIVLRAGIHAGTVVVPDGDVTAVNFTHVIDMTAHIQKACPPGGIAVSAMAATGLSGGLSAVGTERLQVMDTEVAVFNPKKPIQLPPRSMPALPEGA
jgi:class 3 adenylate cyclase